MFLQISVLTYIIFRVFMFLQISVLTYKAVRCRNLEYRNQDRHLRRQLHNINLFSDTYVLKHFVNRTVAIRPVSY
jgi:hypothetical protein